jgi:6-phosphofructokinase 2
MANIITLTLSPTVDKSTSVEKLMAEQKLLCEQPKFEPGGGGINVSRGLKRLGLEAVTIFPSGGLTGQRLQALLEKEQITLQPFEVENDTRENFIVVNRSTNEQFRFGMPGSEIYPKEEKALLKILKELSPIPEFIIASGSLPPGISDDFLARVAQIARKNKSKLVIDTSGDALKHAVEEGVYLLKPNLGELGKLIGKDELDTDLADDAAREIIGKGKCEVIVVSMGAQGAYLVTSDITDHINAPTVKKRSTVGAGDSMVAGMVYGLANGYTIREVARMGIACGTAATMNPGTELFKKDDVERLYKWLLSKMK